MAMSDQAVRTELMGENDPKTYENNYLVEAGAGAGKTYTMVQRIVNQLMNTDCAPQELVAITFTVKSTQEMKRRLDEELKERKKTAGEEEQRKLEKLIQEVGRMQISTIHSFCRTMLETMPFLSGMGPEMKLLENDSDFCRGFFHRKFWANPSAFDTVRKVYGLTYEVLENTFCNACHNGRAEIQYAPPGSADDNEARAIMKIAGDALHGQLHTTLEQIGDDWKYVKPELAELLKMPEPVFQADPSNAAKLASILNQSSSGLPLAGYDEDALKFKSATGWSMDVKQSNADYVKEHPLLDCWPEVKKAWTNGMGAVIKDAAARVVHTLCMSAIAPLADEYWEEKQKQHIVTQDDLLLRTRDMLKNSREAREYFHNRYKVLYVDEFQDTDPVQAEILFYLTSDPNQTNVTGWNSCTPEEGRLFLVGDPKQAIYRFRGADIGVYDMVKTAFGNKGICSLTRNYRSSDKLCKLTTTLFKCPAKVTKAGAKSYFVDENGKYPNPKQAKFAEMVAEQTVSGDQTHVFSYEPKVVCMADQKEVWSDADQVAAFIRTMVDKKIQIPNDDDDNGGTRAVSWKDFMILPARKKVIEEHVTALSKLDIPVNVVGEQTLSSVNAIRRAVLHLKAMTATQDDYALMCLLHQCYQVPLKDLRVFMQRTKHKNIRGVLNPKTLHPIYKAFAQEEQPSEEMLSLCGILEELTELRKMACSMPAMSVIERLLDGGYGIWDPAQPIQERRREYARVQQYLDLIRASELRSFSALAAFAIQCAETTLEYEMPLEAAPDQVQIMNLHKAKGLEGKIVILVNSTLPSFTDRHVFRDPDAKEYSCIKAKNKTLGWAKQWNHNKLQLKENPPRPCAMNEEKEFQEAEKVRLLYVAVTRAAYWLVVCGRAPERPKEKDANDQNAQTAPPKPQAPKTFWQRVVDTPEVKTCKELEEGVKAGNPDLAAALESLRTGQCLTHVGAQGQSNGIAPEEVSPETQELKLKELARERAEIKSYAITPSKLDHDSRSVTPRIKKLGDEGTAALQTGSGDAAQASPVTAEDPCGADWGTIVHRVMELAVRENRYDSDALKRFACQAVEETLPSLLSKGQRQELLGNQPMDMKQAKAYISEKAAGAVSFLAKEDSPLRKEMEGAVCYPELPFVLRVEENSGDLYRHLSAHISDVNARNKPMDVQGIIDLGIRRADGSWVIVDYKTDKLCSGESADQLKARLSRKYTPQILTYAKVLELSGLGSVTHVYLCSVPLDGELIPLTL